MYLCVAASLVSVALLVVSQSGGRRSLGALVVAPEAHASGVLIVIALIGTTVAPWQLFFQQSNVIDKRITPRFIGYERADTTVGSFVVIGGAAAIEVVAVYAVRGTHLAGRFTDALGTARALEMHNYVFGALFAIVLLDASIIGASAVTLSTSYAFGDVFNMKHSLHRKFKDAKGFYATYTVQVALAAGIVLIPGAPLGLITTSVQALAGVLLPSASVFLLLLCNDPEVLGPWVNARWLNVVAGFIISVLLLLSGTLMVGTLFPNVNSAQVAIWLAVVFAVGAAVAAAVIRWRRAGSPPQTTVRAAVSRSERASWRMPPIALLKPVVWAPATRLAMLVLRGYLVVSVLLLIVKAVQLGRGGLRRPRYSARAVGRVAASIRAQ
jgi:hypothetical protein